MTKRADFYILSADMTNNADKRWFFTCQLIEKAYNNGLRLLVRTENSDESKKLDDLLWDFKPTSFVPHVIEGDELEAPIVIGDVIGDSISGQADFDALLNIADRLPANTQQLTRIFEIVPNEPSRQNNARSRYKHYRLEGFELNIHKIGDQ